MKKQLKKLSLSKKSISDLNLVNTILGGDGLTDPQTECKSTPMYCQVRTEIGCPKPPVLKTINEPTC